MTRTGRTLDEYMQMGAAGKTALISFLRYLPPDSALYREQNPKSEYGDWCTTMKTNAILADFFDAFARFATKKGRKAPTYPRPKKTQTLGKGAVPVSEFWEWWNKGR